MKTKAINPKSGIYSATNDYVHALEVSEMNRLVFVSSTMGLEKCGTAGNDLERQLEHLAFDRIRDSLLS